jgi:NADPH-dependent ferric siderophore reductase
MGEKRDGESVPFAPQTAMNYTIRRRRKRRRRITVSVLTHTSSICSICGVYK